MRDVGAAAERKRRPYVSLIWCSTPSGHGNGLRPWIRNNDRRAAHEPVNLPLDCKHAHVSGHSGNFLDRNLWWKGAAVQGSTPQQRSRGNRSNYDIGAAIFGTAAIATNTRPHERSN